MKKEKFDLVLLAVGAAIGTAAPIAGAVYPPAFFALFIVLCAIIVLAGVVDDDVWER